MQPQDILETIRAATQKAASQAAQTDQAYLELWYRTAVAARDAREVLAPTDALIAAASASEAVSVAASKAIRALFELQRSIDDAAKLALDTISDR